jgi:hypothetical protein
MARGDIVLQLEVDTTEFERRLLRARKQIRSLGFAALEWICVPVEGGSGRTDLAADGGDVVVRHAVGMGSISHEMTPEQAREIGLAYLAVAMRAEAGEGR